MDRRLWREPSFDLMGKVFRVNWLYVLLLGALAGVGYIALYSAAGGSAELYATRHAMRFAVGVLIMLAIGLVDIRFIAKLAWPAWVGGVVLLVLFSTMVFGALTKPLFDFVQGHEGEQVVSSATC